MFLFRGYRFLGIVHLRNWPENLSTRTNLSLFKQVNLYRIEKMFFVMPNDWRPRRTNKITPREEVNSRQMTP